jgi:hypothetical protein
MYGVIKFKDITCLNKWVIKNKDRYEFKAVGLCVKLIGIKKQKIVTKNIEVFGAQKKIKNRNYEYGKQ